uniref:Uncharacterized protein n=1 Tax=Rhizophora mucronata TaxID=61149 RepID=A0A2P2QR92_RHIMU
MNETTSPLSFLPSSLPPKKIKKLQGMDSFPLTTSSSVFASRISMCD